MTVKESLDKLISFMVRQAQDERNQQLSVPFVLSLPKDLKDQKIPSPSRDGGSAARV